MKHGALLTTVLGGIHIAVRPGTAAPYDKAM